MDLGLFRDYFGFGVSLVWSFARLNVLVRILNMDSDNLDEFLNRVLTASNAHELGGEVLNVLQQWKNEIEGGEVLGLIPETSDVIAEECERKEKSEDRKEDA